MAYLEELNKEMIFILRTIATEDIAKLLQDPIPSSLSDTPYNTIAYKNLFPFPKIIEAEDVQNTFIFVYYSNVKPKQEGFYYDKVINIDVMSHIDLWQIDEGIRPYILLNKIDELFNKKRINNVKSMREFLPLGVRPIVPNKKWAGYSISYAITDIGRGCE